MLDVHPPHHPTHTWRDFFIHIATITVGLLIAIGLEQTVEAIHHHREIAELREAMQRDEDKAILECELGDRILSSSMRWTAERIAQTQKAMEMRQALAAVEDPPRVSGFDIPIDPAWEAAKASGILNLLSPEEIKAFSEIHGLHEYLRNFWFDWVKARAARLQLDHTYQADLIAMPTPVSVPLVELPRYLDLLRADYLAAAFALSEIHRLHGAQTAARSGERSLDAIQKAEVQPSSR